MTSQQTEKPAYNQRAEAWEDRTEWFLVGVAVVFLIAYAWPILDDDLSKQWRRLCNSLIWITWAFFVIDYVIRLILADKRFKFFRDNPIDLLIVLMPWLGSLRMLQLVKLLALLNKKAAASLHGQVATYVVSSTVVIMFAAALAVYDVERRAEDSNILTFSDAVWWSAVTVTTVGYGDHYPVTSTGRLVAGGLMIAGIALLGVVTATLASWFLGRVQEMGEQTQAATRKDQKQVLETVRELRAELKTTHQDLSDLHDEIQRLRAERGA